MRRYKIECEDTIQCEVTKYDLATQDNLKIHDRL
jgi:hypothetical protein